MSSDCQGLHVAEADPAPPKPTDASNQRCLTNTFQRGWNHQLVIVTILTYNNAWLKDTPMASKLHLRLRWSEAYEAPGRGEESDWKWCPDWIKCEHELSCECLFLRSHTLWFCVLRRASSLCDPWSVPCCCLQEQQAGHDVPVFGQQCWLLA